MIDQNSHEKNPSLAIIDFIQKFSWILMILILIFGWTSPWLMFATFICMIGPIVFSFSYGRAWCGNFCPRSSFNMSILSLVSPNKPFPKILKSTIFRFIVFLLLMMFFAYNLYQSHGSIYGIGLSFIKMMALTALIQIALAIYIQPYAWCFICPMGTVSSFITFIRRDKVDHIKIGKRCISCNTCKDNCPMQIEILSWRNEGEVKDANCIKCRKCIKNCPKKSLEYGSH